MGDKGGRYPFTGFLADLLFASRGVHRVGWQDADFC